VSTFVPNGQFLARKKSQLSLIQNAFPNAFQGFAPSLPARGSMFSARQRLQLAGDTPAQPIGFSEFDLD
jgi:hypothetical protein